MRSNHAEATVKALVFSGAKRWFVENHSESLYEQFLAAVPAEDREIWVHRTFMATRRMPASLYTNMHAAFLEIWGNEGRRIFQEAAGAVAFYDLNAVMKVFMRIGSPGFIAGRFPVIYNQYFNIGRFKIVESSPGRRLTGELEGAGVYGEAGCDGTIG